MPPPCTNKAKSTDQPGSIYKKTPSNHRSEWLWAWYHFCNMDTRTDPAKTVRAAPARPLNRRLNAKKPAGVVAAGAPQFLGVFAPRLGHGPRAICGIVRRERAWAGLRSFAPDRAPVYGFDRRAPGFFWFAGQGGFGIQTAPAAAMLGAALITGRAAPLAINGIDADRYAPGRW